MLKWLSQWECWLEFVKSWLKGVNKVLVLQAKASVRASSIQALN